VLSKEDKTSMRYSLHPPKDLILVGKTVLETTKNRKTKKGEERKQIQLGGGEWACSNLEKVASGLSIYGNNIGVREGKKFLVDEKD
jgi:hypothetical protein